MTQHTGGAKRSGLSYADFLFVPAWLVLPALPPEWVVAAALSFFAWLYVRRR